MPKSEEITYWEKAVVNSLELGARIAIVVLVVSLLIATFADSFVQAAMVVVS